MPSNKQTPAKRATRGTRAAAAAAVVEEPEATDCGAVDVKKEEPDAVMTEAPSDNGHQNGNGEANGDSAKKKPWQRIKEGGVRKIPKDVQKRRRNFRLKKMIIPKAPVMILHELLGSTVQYDVADPIPPQPGMGGIVPMLFIAKTIYQGNEFLGKGPSKSIAKNICAEQVLQFITTQSCTKQSQDAMETDAESEKNEGDEKKSNNFETDTPWSALASLAMFKLFNDWQSQGYQLPSELMKPGSIFSEKQCPPPPQGHPALTGTWSHDTPPGNLSQTPAPEKKQKPKKEKVKKEKGEEGEKGLPENHMEKHPVQLLNEMRGPLEYEETARDGVPPNCVFTLTVKVQDESYSGQGKSKKEAKKAAAEAALSALYNVTYEC